MTAPGAFKLRRQRLTPGTLYHFRARVNGGVHGSANGADMNLYYSGGSVTSGDYVSSFRR